ncbi:hypothetical protein [Streptomyces sp. NPDC004435]|uniref:hypothetical protein n=1 Tax=Streptomyces sp. NPDC004435 TaxID=3364701 RepID=UPI00367D6B1A
MTVLVLGLTQSALHLVFHALAGGHGGAAAVPEEHMAHMGHAGHGGMPAGPGPSGHSADPAMTLAHTLAALGASVCLIHGERLLARLSGLLLRPLLRVFMPATVPVPPGRPVREPARALPLPRGVLLARSRTRRGPPSVTYA